MPENGSLTREEQTLLRYFRALPSQEQTDLLTEAEVRFDARERLKELSSRLIERDLGEVAGETWRH
ncbi:MAG: hypothetical protein IH614_16530 [Desulfuromonadales bacterium]|nr:hypothetical protein [Desulfuromonadales bacterium]